MKDHVGNVRVVSNDITSRAVFTVSFTTKICNFANYYPFGMQQTGTAGSYDLSSDYRYGYNGKEKDDEIKGEANSLDFGARIYDPRVGKILSADPLTSEYPYLTPFQFASNSPISGIDLDGLEYVSAVNWANSNIGNYTIPFMFAQDPPPTFKELKKANWKDVINDSMFCATSTALSYAQANPKFAKYLSKNGYETNRVSGQYEFFEKGGKHHSLISPSKFNKASEGDLLFLQSTTEKGAMSGHVAILARAPIAKGVTGISNELNKLIPSG